MKAHRILIAVLTLSWLSPAFAESFTEQFEKMTDQEKEVFYKQAGKERGEQFVKDYKKIFSAPINFWGKVVDEKGNPIADAEVKFKVMDNLGSYDSPPSPEFKAVSNEKGLFSLTGKKGGELFVAVSKEGYYQVRDKSVGWIAYESWGDDVPPPDYFPTPKNPAIFILKKKGEVATLVRLYHLRYSMPKDGTAVEINLETGKMAAAGQGDIKVEFSSDAPPLAAEMKKLPLHKLPRYGWRWRFSAPGGGFAPWNDRLDFKAPADGYQETVEISMSKDAQQWGTDGKRQSFVKTKSGKYARIEFGLFTSHEGGGFIIEGHYNPAGSRNLESDPGKLIDPKRIVKVGLEKAIEEVKAKASSKP